MAGDHTTDLFNRESLLERLGGDTGLLGEVFELFLEDGPRMVRVVREASERGDASSLERAAHSLKGALLHLSADPVAERVLEERGRSGSLEGSEGDLRKLEEAFEKLEAVLRSQSAD